MLPTEMLLALSATSLGLSIIMGGGRLFHLVARVPPWYGVPQNLIWGLSFLLPALVLLATSILEWRAGRSWTAIPLRISAEVRCWSALILMISHYALIWLIFSESELRYVFAVAIQIPVNIAFLGWSAFCTWRLTFILSDKYPTRRLERDLRHGR